MAYVHQPYPSVRYHRDGRNTLVYNDAEHEALMKEDGWATTPAAFKEEPKVDNGIPDSLKSHKRGGRRTPRN